MGFDRAKTAVMALGLLAAPAQGIEPGWHYSPFPGEGDRASMGCSRDADAEAHACLVVRCEDDFAVGVHVLSSRQGGDGGRWEITADRETMVLAAVAERGPYGARFAGADDADWLLDRLRHGSYIYLRHEADSDAPFAFIDLSGSFTAIAEALYWCAPRAERNAEPGIDPQDDNGDRQ